MYRTIKSLFSCAVRFSIYTQQNIALMYGFANFSITDRYKTNGADIETLEMLSRKLKFPLDDVIKAIQEVGTDEADIEEYIRDRHNRS